MKVLKGISYPFRFNSKGGVATSVASVFDTTRFNESIEQIIRTGVKERVMELDFGSELYKYVHTSSFDETDITLIKYLVKEAIERHNELITVIDVQVEELNESDTERYVQGLQITVLYSIEKFQTQGVVNVII